MRRVLDGFSAHETHRDLPTILAGQLRRAGLQLLRQRPVPILNTSFSETHLSYWLTKVIPGYVTVAEPWARKKRTPGPQNLRS